MTEKNFYLEQNIAIIAEYNPLHQGHLYQLKEAKRQLGKDLNCIIIMSGDFTQRGLPAVLPKELRAECIIKEGTDLVLELPPHFALAPASLFAQGAIATLNASKQNYTLVFGAECPHLDLLKYLACFSLYSECFDTQLERKNLQKQGYHFAKANSLFLLNKLQKQSLPEKQSIEAIKNLQDFSALHPLLRAEQPQELYNFSNFLWDYLSEHHTFFSFDKLQQEIEHVLAQSNNILALEYLKSIALLDFKQQSKCFEGQIQPHLIHRVGDAYLSEQSSPSTFSSATALRKQLEYFDALSTPKLEVLLQQQCSESFYEALQKHFKTHGVLANALLPFLKLKLLELDEDYSSPTAYLSQDMFHKLKQFKKTWLGGKEEQSFRTWDTLLERLRTKNVHKGTWSRALIALILNLSQEQMTKLQQEALSTLQVLKHSEKGKHLLKKIKKESEIPLLFGTNTKKTPLSAKFKHYHQKLMAKENLNHSESQSFLVK